MIRQEAAGIYAWLPLGLRVLKKIEQIVREEQNRAGAIELLMPTLQSPICGARAGATTPMDRRCYGFRPLSELYGPTNEEMINEIFRSVRLTRACRSTSIIPSGSSATSSALFRRHAWPRILMKDAYLRSM